MPRFIRNTGQSWDHLPYWDYLEAARGEMAPHIHAFASNSENHDLVHPNSLHDSWLDEWKVLEIPEPGNPKRRSIAIEARFLGSRWDRHIVLRYDGIGHYSLTSGRSGCHGDLLIHELITSAPSRYVHELVFASDAVFSVEFSDFAHHVEMLAAP